MDDRIEPPPIDFFLVRAPASLALFMCIIDMFAAWDNDRPLYFDYA